MSGATVSGAPADVAAELLRLVRAREPGAEAEVLARRGNEALTRFANGSIHQNVAEETRHVSLRVALDGHVATAKLDGATDEEALRRLVGHAFDAARVRPVDPDWPGCTPPSPAPAVDHWDEGSASATPDERARLVGAFVAAASGLTTAGFCSTESQAVAYASSLGQQLEGRSTLAVLDCIARTGTADGSAHLAAIGLDGLDGALAGSRAAEKARAASDPTDLEPGRYEVVLEPTCVADVFDFLYRYGFSGRAVEECRSFVRPGERQFDPAISLRDDVTNPGVSGLGFDAEGTPRLPLDVILSGVTSAVLHTRRTAAKAGARSTGHALEGGERWGQLMANPVLTGGDRSLEELVAGVERGTLVTDFWYTRILDPRTEVVTGLTRNGVWLIEDGRIARPVRNLRFTQSYVDALAPGSVRGVGSEQALIPIGGGTALVPALHLAGWNFTGGARG